LDAAAASPPRGVVSGSARNLSTVGPRVRIIDGDVSLAIDVARKALVKYMGTDTGPYADEMLKWARDGSISLSLSPGLVNERLSLRKPL